MLINWYPGHMAKARRQMIDDLKLVDIVLELADARIPSSSRNPDIAELRRKPSLLVLTKEDLADPLQTENWMKYFLDQDQRVVLVNAMTGKGLKRLRDEIEKMIPSLSRPPRALIVGIPNVGKSSLINKIANRGSARVGAKPGVTRGRQWVKGHGLSLLDTPGVLWPKLEDQEAAKRLAAVAAIRDEVIDQMELALWLLSFLAKNYGGNLAERYQIGSLGGIDRPEQLHELLEQLGRRLGCIQSGGRVNVELAAQAFLRDFRQGKLGRITLEIPEMTDYA